MRTLISLALATLLTGCSAVIISDSDNHLLFKSDGMTDGIKADAYKAATARCAEKGLEASGGEVHQVGWLIPSWYIEYDCVRGYGTPPATP